MKKSVRKDRELPRRLSLPGGDVDVCQEEQFADQLHTALMAGTGLCLWCGAMARIVGFSYRGLEVEDDAVQIGVEPGTLAPLMVHHDCYDDWHAAACGCAAHGSSLD
jgi:hypothetical protein